MINSLSEYKIGAGLNPAFLEKKLILPDSVTLVEFGLEEFDSVLDLFDPKVNHSLHIARSPISEKSTNQIKYIKKLHDKIKEHKLLSGVLSARMCDKRALNL